MEYLQQALHTTNLFFNDGGSHEFRNILLCIAILLVAYLSRTLTSRVLFGILHRHISKLVPYDTKELFESLDKPLRAFNIVLGIYVVSEVLYPSLQGSLILTLFAIIIFWLIFASLGPIGELIIKFNYTIHQSLLRWALRVLKVLVVFIGVSAILEMWGIQVGAILAGLGILGAAVALGTQDLFKNLIAGFLILSERRFNEGEWISAQGHVEGTVEKIGLRSTLIRRFDQAPVQVPNSQLADVPLINFSRMKHRRIYWSIGLEYSATSTQLQTVIEGIKKIISGNDYVDADKISTFVVVDKFNDSSIDILLYCFTHTTNWGEWLSIKEKLALSIKELVESAGTGFAFPSQSIYIEKTGSLRPPKI